MPPPFETGDSLPEVPLMKSSFRLFALPALVLAAACSSGSSTPEEIATGSDVVDPVAEGKEDNYLSPTSMEYRIGGEGKLDLDAAAWGEKTDAEKEARAQELLGDKFKAYLHFINVYVTNKEHEDSNAAYGGFSGMVRKSSLGSLVDPSGTDKLSWSFMWDAEMAGPRDIMSKLPIETRSNGERYFVVQMPKLTEQQLSYSSYPKDFNPATYEGEIEELEVSITPIPASADAWPEYAQMLEDGKLDMLVLVGGDYNEERYDLKAAEEIFNWLKKAGYQHPAATYKELTLESPPFTRKMKANGKDVAIEISFLHPDIVEDGKLDSLRAKIVEAYESMDVLIYDGHAGEDPSYSGVVYHYNPRHAISANDLAALKLPSKYQLFLFNGCKTYAGYPDALYSSPNKTTKNLDLISTVNFSWLTMQPFTTSGFINELTAQSGGTHDPHTFMEILSQINKSSNYNVYYGVHGIDDNPHGNPYMSGDLLCKSCTSDAACGGAGNRCIRFSTGMACGGECTADDGCPTGYTCRKIASGSQIVGSQCMPKNLQCSQ